MSTKYIRKEFYIEKKSVVRKIMVSILAGIVLILQILQLVIPILNA